MAALGEVVLLAPPPQAQSPAPVRRSDRPVDRRRIAAWTRHVVAGDLAPIAAIFEGHGTVPPEAAWDPPPAGAMAPPLRFLLAHWHRLAADGAPPPARRIDPTALRPAFGYMTVLEPIDGGRDFRYRLHGGALARMIGIDMTGRRLSEHPNHVHAAEFVIALFRAVRRRRRPLFSVRHLDGSAGARCRQTLALPFVDEVGDRVTRLLTATVPIGRDGQMI